MPGVLGGQGWLCGGSPARAGQERGWAGRVALEKPGCTQEGALGPQPGEGLLEDRFEGTKIWSRGSYSQSVGMYCSVLRASGLPWERKRPSRTEE